MIVEGTEYREPIVPRLGDLVLGQVISVGDKIGTMVLSVLFRRRNGKISIFSLPRVSHAYIFRGDVGIPCVSLSEVLKMGDLVLGRVKIDWFRPVFVSLEGDELGVVSARCSNCGMVIPTPREREKLICPACKAIRRTKISYLYDSMLWKELHVLNRIRIYLPVQ